ncbi:amidase [Haloechinothrix halophila]|uniref:amidase n=1 Tax=Haloechinothrix halophila TaxID=1069073 RepID=UPI000418293F|nr:amidase [Haloechinothrix halophila]
MDTEELMYAGLTEQARLVASGEVSSRELTEAVLARINRLNPELNAFRAVLADAALAEATQRDHVPAAERGPLHGVPVAIKDEVDVEGAVTTFGGLANRTPATADAEVVRRLRVAGAVIVGKTTMPEFGQWPFTESATYGATRNPWDTTRTPGGSSGGTATAVASGMIAAALGGDGGGSIRIPSACCGLFGLKPQRGRVSTAPHRDLWLTLGTSGPLTRGVADSALFYDAIRGSVGVDRWHAEEPRMSFVDAAATPPGTLRIGYSATPAVRGLRPDPEHVAALEHTAAALREAGHDVREITPRYPDATAMFTPQFYGGVRDEARLVEHPELLERRTKQTLALARLMPEKAIQWSVDNTEKFAAKVNLVFDDVDLLLTPTIAHRPRRIGALDGANSLTAQVRALPMIAYTALWNLAGNPAAAVPAGFGADGLPLSVQLVGRPHDEVSILQVAAQLETARPWAQHRPVFRS